MKNYKDLINEYNTISKTINNIDVYDRLTQRRKEFEQAGRNIQKIKELEKKYDALDKQEAQKKTYLKILKNNILYAIKEELTKKIITVVNSYAGKKLGEKTLEKLNNDLKAINEDFSIHTGGKDFYIRHKEHYYTFKIDLHFTSDKNNNYNWFTLTDADNKVNLISAEMLFSYDVSRYIDDINMFINNQQKAAFKILDDFKTLSNQVSEYNKEFSSGGNLFEYLDLQSKNIHFIR